MGRAVDSSVAGGSHRMSSSSEGKLGTFSTLSIGIGGMVGGGIFAVT